MDESPDVGFVDLGYAKTDTDRARRQGVAEVIYGEGKTADQIIGICAALLESGQERVLITRLDAEKADKLHDAAQKRASSANRVGFTADRGANDQLVDFTYYDAARIGIVGGIPEADGNGSIVVCAAGTSDLPVAEEAALTAEFLGNHVIRRFDVGVAGIHRLLSYQDELKSAQVVIAVAGMEGALASVVGGLVSCPVIAVPTSVGYGASFGGLAALLTMLNSCASGVSVVNIDNGFGAAFQASLINHLKSSEERG